MKFDLDKLPEISENIDNYHAYKAYADLDISNATHLTMFVSSAEEVPVDEDDVESDDEDGGFRYHFSFADMDAEEKKQFKQFMFSMAKRRAAKAKIALQKLGVDFDEESNVLKLN